MHLGTTLFSLSSAESGVEGGGASGGSRSVLFESIQLVQSVLELIFHDSAFSLLYLINLKRYLIILNVILILLLKCLFHILFLSLLLPIPFNEMSDHLFTIL